MQKSFENSSYIMLPSSTGNGLLSQSHRFLVVNATCNSRNISRQSCSEHMFRLFRIWRSKPNIVISIQFNKKDCICHLQLWDVLACWSWNCIQLWAEARRPFKVFPINSPFYLMVFRRISIMAKYLSFSTENWIIKLFSEIKVEINFVAVRCRKYWTRWREN